MKTQKDPVYGFVKPLLDAHTLGINAVAGLLKDCGYTVIIASHDVELAVNDLITQDAIDTTCRWIRNNHVNRFGVSYRLDKKNAVNIVTSLVNSMENHQLFEKQGGSITHFFFAGLPETCKLIEDTFGDLITTFSGGESAQVTLEKLGVPSSRIPVEVIEGSEYDDLRLAFGREIVSSGNYHSYSPIEYPKYPEYGTKQDTVVKRIEQKSKLMIPLMRAHVGPYSNLSRSDSVSEFINWSRELALEGYLDILSIGTSQLTQSNFGEDWGNQPNGGGVPINSEDEFKEVWKASRPMLVRTYSGTQRMSRLAEMYERSINISWHALSLWWFNKNDERGPYDLYTNLVESIRTIDYISRTNKPYEPNVSHHFAFRGADDVTYIVSAVIAAKLAKLHGIKTFVLQNMLNTPRYTWGIQDLAKSRAMLKLVRELEDDQFHVILQPRAGLDFFTSNLEEAKAQLVSVTALMDDIEPNDPTSPPIIHVVSYSEAVRLADPSIINESIKLTQYSLNEYRNKKANHQIADMANSSMVSVRTEELYTSTRKVINAIEKHIPNTYSAQGLYMMFAAGFLPTPYLWKEKDEFKHALHWKTRIHRGAVILSKGSNEKVSTEEMIEYAISNIPSVLHYMENKYINK